MQSYGSFYLVLVFNFILQFTSFLHPLNKPYGRSIGDSDKGRCIRSPNFSRPNIKRLIHSNSDFYRKYYILYYPEHILMPDAGRPLPESVSKLNPWASSIFCAPPPVFLCPSVYVFLSCSIRQSCMRHQTMIW